MSFDLTTSSSTRTRTSQLGGGRVGIFYDATMVGGTALTVDFSNCELSQALPIEDYVTVRADVILEYEKAITELRLQLLHYKRIVARLSGDGETRDEYADSRTVIPLDPNSVRLVNSIAQARIPSAATFREFEEGEL